MKELIIILITFFIVMGYISCDGNGKYIETNEEFKEYKTRKEALYKQWSTDKPKASEAQLTKRMSNEFCECAGYTNFNLLDTVSDESIRAAAQESIEGGDRTLFEKYAVTAGLAGTCDLILGGEIYVEEGYDFTSLKPKLEMAINDKCSDLMKEYQDKSNKNFLRKRLMPIVQQVKQENRKKKSSN